jgi:predicted glycosyltransferase
MARRRVLLYSQSLSGTGHFVQTYEIARALAPAHDVHLVDGGRPIPRPPTAHPVTLLPLPAIYRAQGKLAPVHPTHGLDAIMSQRRQALRQALGRIQPDVVVIEHFPFSKWDLEGEILGVIDEARVANPGVKIVCSLRDIPPGSADNPSSPDYQDYVRRTLRTYFDLLLVHSDPRLIHLEEHIPWAQSLPLPVAYTGYVSEKLRERPAGAGIPTAGGAGGHVIVSTGGASRLSLLRHTVDAWRHLDARGATGNRSLIVVLPPFAQRDELDGLPVEHESIRLEPFTPDFLAWMATADLSISQAGYNTCANVLETRSRAILVPNPSMYDQPPRARRLVQRGLMRAIDLDRLDADGLAAAILEALAARRPVHDVDLDGARRSCALLATL